MRSKLVIEGDSVYEIDDECIYREKEKQEEQINNTNRPEESAKQK